MLSKNAVFIVFALTASAAGCDRCLAQRASETSTSAPVDGGLASDARSSRARIMVSLLPITDSRVAVSSTVDNPKDYPEHLVDGKLDTAWNGRTGDLGGFIAFRVPLESHVASVQMTAGFDKIDREKKDLFTANHRISRVRITRNARVVREAMLDVNKRGLQSIPVDQPGGDFEVKVLETVPGSNAKWKELVVSEFVVIGDPGSAPRVSPHVPRVRVGSLDALDPRIDVDDGGVRPRSGPWPSIASYCSAFEAAALERQKKRDEDPSYPCAEYAKPICAVSDPSALSEGPPFVSMGILTTSDGVERTRWIAVETSAGWWPRSIRLDRAGECELGDVGTESAEKKATKPAGPGAIAIEIERHYTQPMYESLDTGEPTIWVRDDAERVLHVCRANDGVVTCDEQHVLGKYSGKLGDKPVPFESWTDR